MITLTDKAKQQFKMLSVTNGIEFFWFGVNGGGCAGFNYQLKPLDTDLSPGDEIIEFDDVKIVVDGASIMYLMGTEIDYDNDMMGAAFKFSNPLAANSCGCGTSFSV